MTRRGLPEISLDTAEGYQMGFIGNVLKAPPRLRSLSLEATTNLDPPNHMRNDSGLRVSLAICKGRQIRVYVHVYVWPDRGCGSEGPFGRLQHLTMSEGSSLPGSAFSSSTLRLASASVLIRTLTLNLNTF